MVDHHTASQQYMTHDLREKRSGRECPAQWSWIVPPLGGSMTRVWHHEMRHFDLEPSFLYQVMYPSTRRSSNVYGKKSEPTMVAVIAWALELCFDLHNHWKVRWIGGILLDL